MPVGPCPAVFSAGQSQGWLAQLRRRELGANTITQRPFLKDLVCDGPTAGIVEVNPEGRRVPPLVIRYNKTQQNCRFLAVADEEGWISILDTFAALPDALFSESERRPRGQWLAHKNAVFDLAWSKDDLRMLTGSGDQSVRVWDVLRGDAISCFRGHDGSVKSVCFHPQQQHLLASGARDGAVMIWDTRSRSSDSRSCGHQDGQPVFSIQDAHKSESDRKKYQRYRYQHSRHVKHGVTSAVFLAQGTMLATSGDKDGVVKLWDLRMLRPSTPHVAAKGQKVACVAEVGTPAWGERPHGVTSLVQSPQEDRFLVSIAQGPHLLYSSYRPEEEPLAVFSGHSTTTFYVKACFSGDGTHILSGSGDKRAHIYEVARPHVRYSLEGHTGEVTSVAWCPSDINRLATCGDDCVVRCWDMPLPQHTGKASDVLVIRPEPVKRAAESAAPAAVAVEMGPPTPTLCSQQRPDIHLPATRPDSSAHPSSSATTHPYPHPSGLTPLPAQPSTSACAHTHAQNSAAPQPASGQAAIEGRDMPAGSAGSWQEASEARDAAAGSGAGCATVKQPSRVSTDWQTPPASATLQVVGLQSAQGVSLKRKCLSTGGKLVQRSLCDFFVPGGVPLARPLKAPKFNASTPTPGGDENRQPHRNSSADAKAPFSPRPGPREALKDVTGLGQDGDHPPAPSEGPSGATSDAQRVDSMS